MFLAIDQSKVSSSYFWPSCVIGSPFPGTLTRFSGRNVVDGYFMGGPVVLKCRSSGAEQGHVGTVI